MATSSPSQRPNVILVCVDQWRGDCLSIAGHPVVSTPYLDQWATEGVRFSRAYTATPSCVPARAALFTGLSQRSHGRVGYADGVPWNYPVTLAGEFTRGGYQTEAIGKMHVFPERNRLGFEHVQLHDGFLHFARRHHRDLGQIDDYIPWLRRETGKPEADYFDNGVNCNSIVARPWDKAEELHPTNWVVSQGIEFLRRRDTTKPFFLYLSFHRPHPPFDPPVWAFEQYLGASMPEPPMGDWIEDFYRYGAPGTPTRPDLSIGDVRPDLLQRARAGYYGHMTHIDHQLNRFAESLAEYGLAHNTYICFVSDHGEMMGDHRLFRKSVPYEGSARVPLLLKGPGVSGIRSGSVRDEVVELRDLMPTLLDCAGLPIPESVEGRSLLPLARGETPEWRPYLHGEHPTFGGSMHFITDERFKYIWISGTGEEQLFDLRYDPEELRNLVRSPDAAEYVERARKQLIESLTGRPEGFVADGQLVTGRPVTAVLPHLEGQEA